METHTTSTTPPVKLAELALELGRTDIDELEREHEADVFIYGGFRCVPASLADQILTAHRRARAEAAAESERQAEAALEQRERDRARAIAERQDTRSRVQKFGLQTTTINPNADDTPAVVKMTAAAGAPEYDGSVMTKRPSVMDWIRGRGESGAEIGPSRRQMQENAKANKRANKKEGTS